MMNICKSEENKTVSRREFLRALERAATLLQRHTWNTISLARVSEEGEPIEIGVTWNSSCAVPSKQALQYAAWLTDAAEECDTFEYAGWIIDDGLDDEGVA